MEKEFEEKTAKVKLSTEVPFFARKSKKGGHIHIQNMQEFEDISFLIDLNDLKDVIDEKKEFCFMNVIINE